MSSGPSSTGTVADAMAAVWEESRGLMADRVSTIEEFVIGLLAGRSDPDARRVAQREAHKLGGSMGTFGRQRGSELSREIGRLLQGSEPVRPEMTQRLSQLVVDLQTELLEDAAHAPAASPSTWGDGPEILVVDADIDFALRVVEQARRNGLRASTVHDAVAARSATTERHPALVIVDPALAGRGEDGLGLVAELSAAAPTSPVIVVSEPAPGLDRLTVTRAGAHSLLPKPLSPSAVIASVTGILGRLRSEATVLTVDDDPTTSAFLCAVLGPRGLHVEAVLDPRELWAALDEFRPDLLVLDLDMPNIDGLELCGMVRNDAVWSDLPIVFMTDTDDPEWVRAMFSAGADDHVPKPLVADDVVARIENRLSRSLALRGHDHVDADGSSLPAPPGFTAELDRQLALARRHRVPLALAVVEVDEPATLVGAWDRAERKDALARAGRLLSRSARPEEAVGWAGDGRLAISMYDHETTLAVERAARFLETVREDEKAVEASAGGDLRLTASVGVSAFPRDGDDAAALLAAAGEALRRAQDGGGDRVVATAGTPADGSALVDVLIVDDDEAMGALLIHALATRGYTTEWVRDGAEAAAMLVDHEALGARVVLLDVGLPGLDGLSVLRTLGETGVLKSTRVIMLTLRSSDAEVVEALDWGAFDHVAKPFSLPVLLHRVRRALDSLPA